jgi:hypothetical protein
VKTFEVQQIGNSSSYKYVIFSTSYISPLEQLNEIEPILKSFHGKVLFDLLLSNGNTTNRFIEGAYNGEKFDIGSFQVCKDIDYGIKEFTGEFYKQNNHYIQHGILSKPLQFLVRKGQLR